MEKEEGRAILKRLQRIVNHKGDEQAGSVMAELRGALDELDPQAGPEAQAEREETGGHDRQERGGRSRKGRER